MESLYNAVDEATKTEVKKMYNDRKMGYDEHPALFITDMENLRAKMIIQWSAQG